MTFHRLDIEHIYWFVSFYLFKMFDQNVEIIVSIIATTNKQKNIELSMHIAHPTSIVISRIVCRFSFELYLAL